MASEEPKRAEAKEAEAEAEAGGQDQPKKLPYPRSVFFITGNEFCERFSYYGMKAVLSLYLKNKLGFSEDRSTVIYHAFSGMCYTTPIFGALLADQFFGKYKTIFWISLIYVLGHALKTAAAIPLFYEAGFDQVWFSLIGLFLIAVGTGGIKPCVAAFGGDQFKLPEQQRQLQTFFSIFYFSINAGSLISTFITPIFRKDVNCFGDDTCYSLAFGVPAILMGVATVILVIGNYTCGGYVHKPPQGSVFAQVFGSIWYSLWAKKVPGETHFLDRAKERYPKYIEDTKILLKVLVLYLPLPVYWALFDQQGSRWTFQATRMNGQIGNFIIKPDQIQLINPAFILVLIPLFDQIIYPFLARFNLLKKPLQRIVTGGTFTAIAFFVSGILELELAKTYEVLPSAGESHAHIMNVLPCEVNVKIFNNSGYDNSFKIAAKMNEIVKDLEVGKYTFEVNTNEDCSAVSGTSSILNGKVSSYELETKSETVTGILVRTFENKLNVMALDEDEKPGKSTDPKIKFVFNTGENGPQKLILKPPGSDYEIEAVSNKSTNGLYVTPYNEKSESHYSKVNPGTYDVYWKDEKIMKEITLLQGGVHTFVLNDNDSDAEPDLIDFVLTKENSIHMLAIVPQYFIITVGEIMFSITCLEFSYSQAPVSMKSVLQAVNLLTVAFGNLIVIIVAEAKAFDQAGEFLMFGCLMLVDMALFAFLAYRYTYVDLTNEKSDDDDEDSNMNNIPLDEKPTTATNE